MSTERYVITRAICSEKTAKGEGMYAERYVQYIARKNREVAKPRWSKRNVERDYCTTILLKNVLKSVLKYARFCYEITIFFKKFQN